MNETMRFKLGELLGIDPPCSFLDDEELRAYVERRLSPERQRQFEVHMEGCPACSELRADTGLFESLVSGGLTVPAEGRAFKESDARVRRAVGVGAGRPRPWSWMSWLVPAVAALAIVVAVVSVRPAPLIVGLEGMPLVPPPSVRGLTLAQIYEDLAPVWEGDDMGRAVAILERGVAAHPGQEDLLFYLGVARLRSGDADGAAATLREVDGLQGEIPSEHTRWYLAAALDRIGRRQEACATLESVVAIDGGRAAAAAEIVEKRCR